MGEHGAIAEGAQSGPWVPSGPGPSELRAGSGPQFQKLDSPLGKEVEDRSRVTLGR